MGCTRPHHRGYINTFTHAYLHVIRFQIRSLFLFPFRFDSIRIISRIQMRHWQTHAQRTHGWNAVLWWLLLFTIKYLHYITADNTEIFLWYVWKIALGIQSIRCPSSLSVPFFLRLSAHSIPMPTRMSHEKCAWNASDKTKHKFLMIIALLSVPHSLICTSLAGFFFSFFFASAEPSPPSPPSSPFNIRCHSFIGKLELGMHFIISFCECEKCGGIELYHSVRREDKIEWNIHFGIILLYIFTMKKAQKWNVNTRRARRCTFDPLVYMHNVRITNAK